MAIADLIVCQPSHNSLRLASRYSLIRPAASCLLDGASFVLGVEELLEVAGEGGGAEPPEVLADDHGVGSAAESDGPGPGGVQRVAVGVGVGLIDFDDERGASSAVTVT